MSKKFDVYTKTGCPYCDKAKDLLKRKGYEYNEFTVGSVGNSKDDIQLRINSLGLTVPVKTVPQIFFRADSKEQYVGGYTELERSIDSL